MKQSFRERFIQAAATHSPFCLGFDPSPAMLEAWKLPVSTKGLAACCEKLTHIIDGKVTIIKPQMAYFEAFGGEGILILQDFIAHMRAQGVLVLLDAKRGDIGPTMEAYSRAYFADDAPMRVDAITINGFLGIKALMPAIEAAHRHHAAVFVVVRSSNPEGSWLQQAITDNGKTVAERMAIEIEEINQQLPVMGAVLGATNIKEALHLQQLMPSAFILSPGLGSQGASANDLQPLLKNGLIIPTASRSLWQGSAQPEELLERLQDYQHAFCC
ncbi:MAG: orotidine-5'-phosphate decarboxylase [Alphaproteobacteria bacterium]